jgi:hypothetical protein
MNESGRWRNRGRFLERYVDAESPRWGEKVRENERLIYKDIRTRSVISRLIIYDICYEDDRVNRRMQQEWWQANWHNKEGDRNFGECREDDSG